MTTNIMKAANISPGIGVPTEAELAEINKFTRRALKTEEVYTFSVVLCDNEVDRDHEQFSPAALQKLAELFIGKAGGYNHSRNAHEQVMRIFSADVESDTDRLNSVDEPYAALKAKVYLLRGKENEKLINAIDAGIRKEVSVSCAVRRITCSICGKPPYGIDPCPHMPGLEYVGKACYRILDDPSDAYEFSFVMVPAQPAAGVTKSKQARELAENNNQEEGAILSEQELREQYPDLITGIETAAADAQKAAVAAERARLEAIDKIAGKIHDTNLVFKAKYGDNPMSAEQLAFAYLQTAEDDGAQALKAMEKAGKAAEGVKAAGNAGAEPAAGGEPTDEELQAAGAAAAKAYNEMIGGPKNG